MNFSRAFFDRVREELSYDYDISVSLPRFTIDGASVSLVDSLRALGMELAFSAETVDFSGIGLNPDELHISDVVHQAFIGVDEEGTEAAAATARSASSAQREVIAAQMRADFA